MTTREALLLVALGAVPVAASAVTVDTAATSVTILADKHPMAPDAGINLPVYTLQMDWHYTCSSDSTSAGSSPTLHKGDGIEWTNASHPDDLANPGGTKVLDVDPGGTFWPEARVSCMGAGTTYASQTVTGGRLSLPPELTIGAVMSQQPPMIFSGCLPLGREVQLFPAVQATYGMADESLDFVVSGGGIDYRQTFYQGQEPTLDHTQILVTATAPGAVEIYVVKKPYGQESTHVVFQALPNDCEGADAGATGQDAGSSSNENSGGASSKSGCSSAAGALLLLPALAAVPGLLRRRSRRTP